jgi:predicted SAM-dependent methyltransferase
MRERITLRARLRTRRRLAARYLSGAGIEIGALHLPLRLHPGATARYLDHVNTAELRRRNSEVGPQIVEVSLVDDGERLGTVADQSVDFIVANHFIEHCEDPIGTIRNHLRVVRPGGRVFMAVPDPRRSFDRRRPSTSWDHLLRDFEQGPEGSRTGHYEEWMRLVENVEPAWVEVRARHAEEIGRRIHFHVWSRGDFRSLLRASADQLEFPLDVETVRPNLSEFVAIFTRTDAPLPDAPLL